MSRFDKLLQIDRRWIFLTIGVVVVVPFFFPLGLPIVVTDPVRTLYDAVEAIPPGSKPLLLSVDYSPSTVPELDPMSVAILRHAFSKGIRVAVLTLDPAGYGLAERALVNAAEESGYDYRGDYGKDYVFLGFRPGIATVILGMGVNIEGVFPEDAYGTPLSEIPMMDGIRNYGDVPLIVTLSSWSATEAWIYYAHQPYHATVGSGVTAVSATDYYPFLDTGQLVGLLGGMRGAAEYEELIRRHDQGARGMDSQSAIHVLIIILIIIGNVAYFGKRGTDRTAKAEAK